MLDDPTTCAAIRAIIRRAGLKEAVGILYRAPGEPEIVLELNNISDEPQTSYVISTTSLIDGLVLASGIDTEHIGTIAEADVVVWHSHPTGAKGPSLKDMRSKVPGLRYAVVVMDSDTGGLDFVEY
jgi:proteasome lid subunit RPN8/RPN11